MSRLNFTLIFGLIFGISALGCADELEDFWSDQKLPIYNLLRDKIVININDLIDENIDTIRNFTKSFDPSKLPDLSLWGKGQLTNGWLSKISTFTRTGDSFLKYVDKIIIFDLRIGYDILKYDYDYAFKLWLIPRCGKVHGTIENMNINLQLSVDFRNYAIGLEKFKLEKLGKLGLELEGTFGDKIRSFIGTIILNHAKYFIINTVEEIAFKVIQEKINEFNNQIPNPKHHFTFTNLVKLNRDRYVMENFAQENYLQAPK